jgi:pimeloyl-ACP methyl ester carboxylesterase
MSSGKVISFDGVPIDYQVRGEGAPALVFVHCWSGDQTYWKNPVSHFSPRYQVVTLDLAGHGKSGVNRKDWTISAFAQDVIAVVNELDLDEVVLIGHSMGGTVVLETAVQIPERLSALVAVDTLFDKWARFTPEQRERWLVPFRTHFVETTQNWVRHNLFLPTSDAALVDWVTADMSAAPPEVGSASMDAIYEWGKKDFEEALGSLRTRVFMIQAESNAQNLQVVKSFASSFESFQVMEVAEVGHFIMMEEPETFNRLLAQAIDQLK